MFSNPHDDDVVAMAWEAFQNGEVPPRGALRSLIGGSWQRCADAKVDPHRRAGPPPISEQDLYLLRERRRALLAASAPVLASAGDYLCETGTMMALADSAGTILCAEGDPPTLERAETIRLVPGSRWSESVCGTNAIGTALATAQSIQIHSAEHFCAGIKRWTGTATVVCDPSDGEVLGAIDLSGLSSTFSRQSMALVVTAARRIEGRLMMGEMESRARLLEGALGSCAAAAGDAFVLFDRCGRPVKTSEQAQIAIADAGGALDLEAVPRLPELAANHMSRGVGRARLPAWLRPEWLEPLMAGGEYLGTLLVLPPRSRRRAQPPVVECAAMPGESAAAFASILTGDAGMRDVIARAALLAPSRAPVLLEGETGTGKEEFARALHGGREGAYIALNCGGLSRELLASELFGYAEGAFTGARKGGMIGKVEAADGGTLFLDELGEMPLEMQSQLLRVLEQKEIHPLGETSSRRVDFRLVSATHRDLRQEVAAGRFRMDLYYRVTVTRLHIPALRERTGDALLLARHFLAKFRQVQGRAAEALPPEVEDALAGHNWPGNVRELRNLIEGAVLVSREGPMTLADFALDAPCALQPADLAPKAPGASVLSMAQGEEALVVRAVSASHGNLALAARRLNIAKSTLYAKLRRFGLNRDGTHRKN